MRSDFLRGRRLLVLSPHPDDETFGCAGLMARAVQDGAEVACMVLSAPDALAQFSDTGATVTGTTRRAEFEAAMDVLGVHNHAVLFESDDIHLRLDAMPQKDLIGLVEQDAPFALERFKPDILCIPAPSYNQDHDALHRAALSACRPHLPHQKSFCPVVLAYEQPQLGWASPRFEASVYMDISRELDRKLDAYRCYASQIRDDPHHASVESVERLARVRGSEVAVVAAEAYRSLRLAL